MVKGCRSMCSNIWTKLGGGSGSSTRRSTRELTKSPQTQASTNSQRQQQSTETPALGYEYKIPQMEGMSAELPGLRYGHSSQGAPEGTRTDNLNDANSSISSLPPVYDPSQLPDYTKRLLCRSSLILQQRQPECK